MSGFNHTELEAGEEILFGPVTSVKTTSFTGGAGPSQGSISKSSGRTVGITNRRIIVEDMQNPSRSQTIPNEQVQRVSIKRKKRGITITKAQTASGTVKVDLPNISPQKESLLAATFPNAEIGAATGVSKGVMIAAAVIAGLIVLCCLVSIIGPMLSK